MKTTRCFPLFATMTLLLLPSPAQSAEFKFPGHTFTLPDGFTMEHVAGPPLVNRPIEADFDEQGRLYVSDSSGSNDKPDKQLQEKPHRLVRLEDTDGDGKYDQSVVFADKLMFPEGVLWHDGAVYCSAPPSIWKIEDTNGDGVADRRTEWHEGKTLTGCANDLHGPYLGPDGWIYWCKGAFAKQTYERPGRPTISDSASHMFRCRPDHSEFESVMSGGMDNPVAVVFSPEGEPFFTTTFFVHPEAGRRDAIVHSIYGAVYPKTHGVLDGLKRTGDLLPPLTHLGPAVPCGLVRYASRAFGDDYENNLFSCQFNLRKVQRHILEPSGATFRSRDIDFLVSDNPDFHPTDVLEDADGSLLVLDTGGWYKICCPTSQLPKPDVLGAVYRIRKAGAPKIPDPRGLKIAWAKYKPKNLAGLLGDSRPAVRNRAIAQLGKQGQESVTVLKQVVQAGARAAATSATGARRFTGKFVVPVFSVEARRNAVWALTRIDGPGAREAVRVALADSDASVRQVAVNSAGLRRDAGATPQLLETLRTGTPHLQRNAAAALGRIGDKSAVPALFAAVEDVARQGLANPKQTPANLVTNEAFRVMEHSLIYALIEIGDSAGVRQELEKVGQPSRLSAEAVGDSAKTPTSNSTSSSGGPGAGRMLALRFVQRAALIALDQIDGGGLTATDVLPHLHSNDPVLKQTASWIVSHHSDWGKDLADFFRQRLAQPSLPAEELSELQQQLGDFTRNEAIQQLIAQMCADRASPLATRHLLLRVMAKAPVREMPAAWRPPLHQCLADPQEGVWRGAVAVIRALPLGKTNTTEFVEPLLRLAHDQKAPAEVKLEALAALPNNPMPLDVETFEFLCGYLDSARPPLDRTTAATVLGRMKLDDAQLMKLADSLPSVGPMELSKLIGAFENKTNETVGAKFVSVLKHAKGVRGARPDVLKPIFAKFGATVQEQGDEILRALNADLAQQQTRITQLVNGLPRGDRDHGRRVFESQKTVCSTCHQVGYLGGRVGPDLTKIGSVRTERDLMEAILYPSASFVRSYEPMTIRTKDGEEYSGVLRQEGADSIVIISGANASQRFAMADVAEMRPGTLSIMPEGIDQQLNQQELADLVAFLKSLK